MERPILYGTTDEFLRSAGVESIEALHQSFRNRRIIWNDYKNLLLVVVKASRRKAEELITEGKVQVNGRRITELEVEN